MPRHCQAYAFGHALKNQVSLTAKKDEERLIHHLNDVISQSSVSVSFKQKAMKRVQTSFKDNSMTLVHYQTRDYERYKSFEYLDTYS